MAKLIQNKESFQYDVENLKEDSNWGFQYSFFIQPLNQEASSSGRSFKNMNAQRSEALKMIGESKLDPIDRFENVVELKKENFRKAKKSSYENWDKKIAQFCINMHQSIQRLSLIHI
eukprot:TRINITY_DN23572_c0_g1_i1.p1 TRINITY_DN23572_c0_g1~~TRINITY_DN23572_c0_g1_i1.p1  ORF type:complete len:117 (-),score=18.80 TRINITY_DN23572_c0_g1_i1:116-466(-)